MSLSPQRHCFTALLLGATVLLIADQLFRAVMMDSSLNKQSSSIAVRGKDPAAPVLVVEDTNQYKEITYTRIGWFQKDATSGLQFGRSLAGKALMEAVIEHPRYNASAWDDLNSNPDASRPIVAFLDVETCLEVHWPRFGQDYKLASDLEGGRSAYHSHYLHICDYIEKAMRSPAMSAPESRLVVLKCVDNMWKGGCDSASRNETIFGKLVIGHRSAHKSEVHRKNDFGLPPLPVKPVWLNQAQLDNIRDCNESRKYKFYFNGRTRIPFPEFDKYLKPLHGRDGIYAKFQHDHYHENNTFENESGKRVINPVPKEKQDNDTYSALLKNSTFAGVPRGDKLYSVRFAEVLSAAAIPVIYADGWVLPYTKEVVDWSKFTVMIPQGKMNQTFDILDAFPPLQRCKMQQQVLWYYQEYVADSKARLRGILKVLESRYGATRYTQFAPGDFI